ncbi:hypothetical protein BRC81_12020 [Halobacteriales archaeon QS_1_68_20]|nr:MAG: hypothetical protein BRC81_12020 [Halobacteriales archaeon QS_1_68_20]
MSTLDGPPLFGSGDEADGRRSDLARIVARSLAPGVERAAFWTAVVLPFLYVPLLVGGVATSGERVALGVLLGLNFLTLYAGHDHDPR